MICTSWFFATDILLISTLGTILGLMISNRLGLFKIVNLHVYEESKDGSEESESEENETSEENEEPKENFEETDKDIIEAIRKSNIKNLTNKIAPILINYVNTEPVEMKEVVHTVVKAMDLSPETTSAVINHFNEDKIKQMQNMLKDCIQPLDKNMPTDDTILVNTLDNLAH